MGNLSLWALGSGGRGRLGLGARPTLGAGLGVVATHGRRQLRWLGAAAAGILFYVSVGVQPWADSYYDIGTTRLCVHPNRRFLPPFLPGIFAYRRNRTLVFSIRTTNITNITYNNNVINNYGPQYQRISQLTQQQVGQQVPNYRINYAALMGRDAAFKTSAQGNQLNVVAPPSTLRPVATVKPQVAKELGKTQVDRGWRNVPQTQSSSSSGSNTPSRAPGTEEISAPKPLLPDQTANPGGHQRRSAQHPGTWEKVSSPPTIAKLKPFVQKPANHTPENSRNSRLKEDRSAGKHEAGRTGEKTSPASRGREKGLGQKRSKRKSQT